MGFFPSFSCVHNTTSMLTKPIKKKLDGNYTRMLHAVLNKSWKQHPTKQQQFGKIFEQKCKSYWKV